METTTIDICEILGFNVTCFILTEQSEIKSIDYVICNPSGEIVSQKYKSAIEPMQLLREIESQAGMQH